MPLQTPHQPAADFSHTALGIVHAPRVAVRKHHATVDHGRAVSRHHGPAVALRVNDAQQLGITDVTPRHVPHVHGQPAGQAQAGQRIAEKDLGQVARLLKGLEGNGIQTAKHLPAGVVKGTNATDFTRKLLRQGGNPGVVVPAHRQVQVIRQVIVELNRIGDGVQILPHVAQGPGQQVGGAPLAKAENHGGTHVEAVAGAIKAAGTTAGNQVTLQHQGAGTLGGQLGGRDQTANAGTNDNGIPGRGGMGHPHGRRWVSGVPSWCVGTD